jgi:hypothetical protein
MGSANVNEAQTNLGLLPVVISWPRESKDRSGENSLGWGVRQLHPSDFALALDPRSRKKFQARYGEALDAQVEKELLFVIQLSDAVSKRSLKRLKVAIGNFCGQENVSDELRGFRGTRELAQRLSIRTATASPTVWWSDSAKRLVFGLACPDIKTAMFVLALGRIELGSIGTCEHCHGPLLSARASKRFCSHNCRSAHHMRARRAREQSKRRAKQTA